MGFKSNKLKKTLTSDIHINVLKIVGSSPQPLSTYQIFKQSKTKYAYEVIKELHKHGFLTISYNQKTQNEIDMLESSLGTCSIIEGYEIRSKMITSFKEEQQIDKATMRIAELKGNNANWRYALNFKGFLLYLLGFQNHKVNYKITNNMINNLKRGEEFRFLEYLDTFDDDVFASVEKVDLLIEIAIELQFQLKTLTQEYLSYYLKRRVYDEIAQEEAIKTNRILNTISFLGSENKDEELMRQQQQSNLVRKLLKSKISLLNELISNEQFVLETMMIELNRTKQKLKQSFLISSA